MLLFIKLVHSSEMLMYSYAHNVDTSHLPEKQNMSIRSVLGRIIGFIKKVTNTVK